MKNIGITRRIDDLGRLVIPKEIRKNLKIRDNDQIEINVIDNKIVLNKYNNMEKDVVINKLLNSLKKVLKCSILYTSKDYIIDYALLSKDNIGNNNLPDEIVNIINKRDDIVINNYPILFGYSLYRISPIIVNGDLLGSLIYLGKDLINNELFLCFIKIFLENYLE